ncbi:hypothetical protein DRN63_02380 [Nanoarchaeota archaeon]|nr:MAG: hypothetical protein DRN63_02380 [Nanoarchaeota archaeon]
MQYQQTLFYPIFRSGLEEIVEKLEKARKEISERIGSTILPEEFCFISLYLFPCMEDEKEGKELITPFLPTKFKNKRIQKFLKRDLFGGRREIFLRTVRFANEFYKLGRKTEKYYEVNKRAAKDLEKRSERLMIYCSGGSPIILERTIGDHIFQVKLDPKNVKRVLKMVKKLPTELSSRQVNEILKVGRSYLDEILKEAERLRKLEALAYPFFHEDLTYKNFLGSPTGIMLLFSGVLTNLEKLEDIRVEKPATFKLREFFYGDPRRKKRSIEEKLEEYEIRISAIERRISEILKDKDFKGAFQKNLSKRNYRVEILVSLDPAHARELSNDRRSSQLLRELRSLYKTKEELRKRSKRLEEELNDMEVKPTIIHPKGVEEERPKPPKRGSLGEFLMWVRALQRERE